MTVLCVSRDNESIISIPDLAFRFVHSTHCPEDRENQLFESGSCRMSSDSLLKDHAGGIERKCVVLIFPFFCIKAKGQRALQQKLMEILHPDKSGLRIKIFG